MRIGVYLARTLPLDRVLDLARSVAASGLDSVFFGQVFGWDALTLAALAGQAAPGLELGTAVVHTYPRHPVALAGQALTTAAALSGPLTLGIGPSHPPIIENAYGLPYHRPARHSREFLSVLLPLLRGERVDFHGETVNATAALDIPDPRTPSVLLAALGPTMLDIAGGLADGTVTTWTTPEFLDSTVVPRLRAAAAGRPAPRVAAIVTTAVTDDPGSIGEALAQRTAPVGSLPSYRELLDRQGLSAARETAALGDEAAVADRLRAYAAAGVTDLLISLIGTPADQARTLALLRTLRAEY
ncbi:F420-dependent oxidoreductase-like protein [Nocardia transvalensis]|uniref:F420-dependent oxidoreductase-like protein n=1 Tax=Nocardia transvalensis TaxID=37333 RepID=A0A7W9ULJ3_9NOCA|nr:TIGR03564 family F420-dependent LLM class oxidoreductase [Nocardia transvalensis]MBB5917599.1 F420-dependent oxidoreductase-like protein [Nocardia transvalensis]